MAQMASAEVQQQAEPPSEARKDPPAGDPPAPATSVAPPPWPLPPVVNGTSSSPLTTVEEDLGVVREEAATLKDLQNKYRSAMEQKAEQEEEEKRLRLEEAMREQERRMKLAAMSEDQMLELYVEERISADLQVCRTTLQQSRMDLSTSEADVAAVNDEMKRKRSELLQRGTVNGPTSLTMLSTAWML